MDTQPFANYFLRRMCVSLPRLPSYVTPMQAPLDWTVSGTVKQRWHSCLYQRPQPLIVTRLSGFIIVYLIGIRVSRFIIIDGPFVLSERSDWYRIRVQQSKSPDVKTTVTMHTF